MTRHDNEETAAKAGPAARPAIYRRILVGGSLALLSSGAAQAGPTISFGEEGFLKIDYQAQFWGQYEDFTSASDSGSQFDFFLRRSRLAFSGSITNRLGFYAQLEATSDGQDSTLNTGEDIYYRDAYLTYTQTDALRFIAGKFKQTFTRENLEACFEPLTMDRAETIAYTPFGRTRDMGVAMWGNLADAMVQYRVMVADGREGDVVAEDSPRVTGRVHLSLLDPEYQYGYNGTYLGTKRVLTIGASYDYQADVAYADHPNEQDAEDYSAWTADLFFEYPFSWGTPTISGAYMDYTVNDAINENPDPELPVESEIDAYYAKAGYLFPGEVGPGRLQVFYRHEDSDYNNDNGLYDQTWNSAGLNYYIDGQRLKASVEYARIDFDEEANGIPPLQDHEQVKTGLQVMF